ncbi:MAG: lysophospholipid acyltransferase family protein [Candidatus Contendobacter sp.]|nr:lysophospholipid acyltransferase family protein [Candidatus Contendobacter sp.]MDS4060011.1 lysophospholipid acyltransferase family protein [Candidatus Contendobacter sp.]
MGYIALRLAFFLLIVKPFLLLAVGVNVRHRDRLPAAGPALIVANHNSHLDALVLMALLPLRLLPRVRPAASADYFLRGRRRAWFATRVIGIIPVAVGSGRSHADVLGPVRDALAAGDIVIFFPEGTRGEPERLGKLKTGIVWLVQQVPNLPVCPVRLHGLGKVLPKGDWLPVPFFCDAWVGEPLRWEGDPSRFMAALAASLGG